MAQTYGPVFSLYMAETHMVFVNGFSSVKEVLVTKGTEFAGRPIVPIIDYISNLKGIILAHYGQVWKEQRKFALTVLRNLGLGKRSMEERILDEATYLIQAFKENMSVPFDPYDVIGSAVTNIMSTLVFGKRFEYDDGSYRNLLELINKSAKLIISPWTLLFNTVPFVRKLPLPHQTLLKVTEEVLAFCTREVEEHKATHIRGQPRDFIDKYLEEIQKSENKGLGFEDSKLLVVVSDLFSAGSETTARTLQWALLYMVAFPEIQEKSQKEIDTILGENTCLKYKDRGKLPYTNAVIHEIQRFSNVLPLGVAHAPIKDVQFHGYTIPKGTMVFTNLVSVHHDKTQWKYPCEFNPSNFLNDEGDFLKPEAFMPFSAGPRMCLGENLARMELFLFFTSILRSFQVFWPDQSKAPDLTPNFGLTQFPNHFKVALKCRQQT
ncbi:cytochrome P450 2J2-like [Tiliqua scincoides]|uniref:cytochrome P450 2J2-like n=1 Tax=Tiliqua scincoides TaxID=71010 RepID=UPI0034625E76